MRYVELHAKTPQDGSTGKDGEHFLDVAEIHVARKPGSALGPSTETTSATTTATTARVNGTVIPRGERQRCDSSTAFRRPARYAGVRLRPAAGNTAVARSATLSGLQPSTTYRYRIVAVRGGVSYPGAYKTFKTAAAPKPPAIIIPTPQPKPPAPKPTPPTNPNPPAAPKPTLLLDLALKANRKGFFKVNTLFGDAAPPGDARITVLNKKRKRLARATVPVTAGRNVLKTLRLNRRGRKAIKRGRSKRVTLELRLPSGDKLTKSVRLRRSRR